MEAFFLLNFERGHPSTSYGSMDELFYICLALGCMREYGIREIFQERILCFAHLVVPNNFGNRGLTNSLFSFWGDVSRLTRSCFYVRDIVHSGNLHVGIAFRVSERQLKTRRIRSYERKLFGFHGIE